MRLTRRGRRVLTAATLIICGLLWLWASSIPDLCLTRAGYRGCSSLSP